MEAGGSLRARFAAAADQYGWSVSALAAMQSAAVGRAAGASPLPQPRSPPRAQPAAATAAAAAAAADSDSDDADVVAPRRRGGAAGESAAVGGGAASPPSPAPPPRGGGTRTLTVRAGPGAAARRKSGMRRSTAAGDSRSSSDADAIPDDDDDGDSDGAGGVALSTIRARVLATPAADRAAAAKDDDAYDFDDDFLVPDDVEDALEEDGEEAEAEEDEEEEESEPEGDNAEEDGSRDMAAVGTGAAAAPAASAPPTAASVRRLLGRLVVCDSDDDEYLQKTAAAVASAPAGAPVRAAPAPSSRGDDDDDDDFIDAAVAHTRVVAIGDSDGGDDESGDDAHAGVENAVPTAASVAPRGGKAVGLSAGRSGAACAQLRDGDVDPATGLVYVASEEGGGKAGAGASARGIFRNRRHRDAVTAALFAEYNQRVFGGALPSGTLIEWGARLTKTAGLTYTSRERMASLAGGGGGGGGSGARRHGLERSASECELVAESAGAGARTGRPSLARVKAGCAYHARIVLSTKVVDSPAKLAQTLLHEMCHAAAWIVDGVNRPPHGAVFAAWAKTASRLYPRRSVSVCHSYEIAYKFHYTCMACGFIYGRHSKSIDTEAVRCGRCGRGRLVLATTTAAAAAAADAPAAPAAPRTPSAYQAFMTRDRPAALASLPPGATPQAVMAESARRWRAHKEAAAAAAAAPTTVSPA